MLFADPHWPMWYLAVLFLWRLATPLLRSPGALAVAVAVALFGGYLGAEVFDTARAMGLLPFFVMGLLVRREHLDLLRQRAARLVGAAVMTLGFLGASLIDGRLATEWLYWRSGYSELDATLAEGMAVRAGLLVVCTLLAVSFFTLVPRRGGWFARLGAATLVVYLFHGFFVKTAEYAGLGAWAAEHPALAVLVTTTASVVLALTLAAPPVARRLNVAVDPVGSWRRHRQNRQHRQP
jgi:fucose 4-O-acetylase-like acetyltransferase